MYCKCLTLNNKILFQFMFNSRLINQELREYLSFSRKTFRADENMNSYVTFNKESNQTVAVYNELLSAQILPGRVS